MPKDMNVSELLDIGLMSANMTGAELAERMGVTPGWISNMRRQKSITPKTFKKIASGLGMTGMELMAMHKEVAK